MLEPELWRQASGFLVQVHSYHVSKLKHLIKWNRDESILEIGIGDGNNSKTSLLPILPQDYKEFIGCDISGPMIASTRKLLLDKRMKFIELDISSEKVPNEYFNRFDHIFSFAVLHSVQNTRQAIQNMYKMLKPGGQIILTYANEISTDVVYPGYLEHPKWKKYNHKRLLSPYYTHPDPPKEYKKILSDVGFKEYYYIVERSVCELPNKKAFEDFCLSVNPIFKELPEEDYEEYKSDFIKSMTNNKLNFTTKCPETGKEIYNTSFDLNVVVANKNLKSIDKEE